MLQKETLSFYHPERHASERTLHVYREQAEGDKTGGWGISTGQSPVLSVNNLTGIPHKPTSMDPGRVGCCPILLKQRKDREELSDSESRDSFWISGHKHRDVNFGRREKLQLLFGSMALDLGVAEFRPGGTQGWLSKREPF